MSEQVSAGITDTDSLVSDGEPERSNYGNNGENTTEEVGPKYPWTKVNLLGKGRFATVYEAVDRVRESLLNGNSSNDEGMLDVHGFLVYMTEGRWVSVGMWFAAKEVSLDKQDEQGKECISQLMQEIEVLKQVKHDNIVQYLGSEKSHDKLYIFEELVSKGTLASICGKMKLSESQISAYTRQILKAIKYLHDRPILHRDIKCANVLVDTKGICKLADFGMAKQLSSLDQLKSCKGDAYWMAPEVIDPKKAYGLPADIWSLGCSIIEMATRAPPFAEMEWNRAVWTVGDGAGPPIPDCLSEVAKDFVKHCLEVNPANRGTANELLEHKFVVRGSKSESVPNDYSSIRVEDSITWQTMCDPVNYNDEVSAGVTDADSPIPDGEAEPSNHGSNGEDTTDKVGPKSPWTKVNLLGKGSFTTVYEAVDSVGMWFAAKEVSLDAQDKPAKECISQLMQEIELLKHVKHDNIVQYLGSEKSHDKLYIFEELVRKGPLASICGKVKLSESQISAYTRQILKAIKYLHDRRIVHRDIKCANILVDTKGISKLADFGLAKQLSSLDQLKSCKGDAYWMAPEVIDSEKPYGPPADIWSLGCSIIEMATGSRPFADMALYEVLWTVGHGTAPPIPDCLSEVAKDFVKQCLEVNPANRATATELLEHQFVGGGSKFESLPNEGSRKWFEDPITWEIMCDPVKCNDGFTYDRWTIIDNDLQRSPMDRSLADFCILCDDINFRSQLFENIPQQVAKFRSRRQNYREVALQKTHALEFKDAVKKLANVLKWAPLDTECQNKLSRLLRPIASIPVLNHVDVVRERETGGHTMTLLFVSLYFCISFFII